MFLESTRLSSRETTDDPTANIGIRLVMAIAKDVEYSSTLRLNNLTVKL